MYDGVFNDDVPMSSSDCTLRIHVIEKRSVRPASSPGYSVGENGSVWFTWHIFLP